eukprot:CAMPEP_0176348826 /NCGR_PEP_ID=MMETSP0126-20121128/8183_1 /TAXON_ID=141414 ORGANISM="Strombidinopsis acuminatum, Strain SPMC142" /NCGR_SAMPLE_ID=MMETSP0126 /ASSEMBLY_ACC=CAM_ASM_000229 /LENGTH=34 /DNA_ID= /DNA_START= /DNA_END= /DNA_ORIENTATION=
MMNKGEMTPVKIGKKKPYNGLSNADDDDVINMGV